MSTGETGANANLDAFHNGEKPYNNKLSVNSEDLKNMAKNIHRIRGESPAGTTPSERGDRPKDTPDTSNQNTVPNASDLKIKYPDLKYDLRHLANGNPNSRGELVTREYFAANYPEVDPDEMLTRNRDISKRLNQEMSQDEFAKLHPGVDPFNPEHKVETA